VVLTGGASLDVSFTFDSTGSDTRLQIFSFAHAESVLRKNCGIRGSTPLPPKVRKLIGETIAAQKLKHPGCFIQVRIDTESLSLKVSRRNENKEWTNNYETLALGMDIMDIDTVRNVDTAMEVSVSQSSL
jgi:hypothetical protein